MVQHLGGRPCRGILGPVVLEVPHILLFLCIHGDYRLTVFHEASRLGIDVCELGVPVHMRLAHLQGLLVELQAVAHLGKKLSDLDMADAVAPVLKLLLEIPKALRRPAQRVLGIADGGIGYQRLKGFGDAGVRLLYSFPSCTLGPYTLIVARRRGLRLGIGYSLCRFLHAKGDGGTRRSGKLAQGLDAAVAQSQCLDAQELASLVLGQHGHGLGYPVLGRFIYHADSIPQQVQNSYK